MSLPGKSEKGYLEIVTRGRGSFITAQKEHIAELDALLAQYGIPVHKQQDPQSSEGTLFFGPDADLAKAREVLEGYKTAKGS